MADEFDLDLTIMMLLNEALAVHGLLLKLGIPGENIYMNYSAEEPLYIVATQGDLSFTISVGQEPIGSRLSAEEFCDHWRKIVNAFNDATDMERESLVETSFARQQTVELITRMTAKGFVFEKPAAAN